MVQASTDIFREEGDRISNTYSTVLEAEAVRRCMELAMDWGYEDVIFETDAQIVKIDAQTDVILE
ncbi:uncharacterized protein G2W53_014253 [Senna tora]|uniref:RNase H type-1 domain-containing protein n=1 Tax=Senna tora TaxID=362788 RepID=A0A834WT71_9FABA|nr:uncharacterized protein G2W53_014253 [Senna tora]